MAIAAKRVETWLLRLIVVGLLVYLQFQDQLQVQYDHNAGSPYSIPPQHPQQQRQAAPAKPKESKIHFVLFLGLEGVGHHLISKLVGISQAKQDMVSLKMHPTHTTKLYNLLFQSEQAGSPGKALFSSPCRKKKSKTLPPNVTKIEGQLVTLMQQMKSNADASNKHVVVPANTLFENRERIHGMLSYPQFDGACRTLNYPNMDVWYHICDLANVECSHVYLYRDPYDVLHSTTKRHFHHDPLAAIHLYTTLLNVIMSQLTIHKSRTIACIGLFEDSTVWQPFLQDLLGISTADFTKVYSPPPKRSTESSSSSSPSFMTTEEAPAEFKPYMDSLVQLHNKVIQLCQDSLK